MVYKANVKIGKKEDILICSIIPTAMIFLKMHAVFLFVTLYCHDMQRNQIQKMALPMSGTVFCVFGLN